MADTVVTAVTRARDISVETCKDYSAPGTQIETPEKSRRAGQGPQGMESTENQIVNFQHSGGRLKQKVKLNVCTSELVD